VLASFHWFLSRDSRTLVLEPIERMVASVSELADNPLAQQVRARGTFNRAWGGAAEASAGLVVKAAGGMVA